MKKQRKNHFKRLISMALVLLLSVGVFGACDKSPLDPKNPVTITLWHYYTGAIKGAFDAMVTDFNENTGRKKGITVNALNKGNIAQLEKSLNDSSLGVIGSENLPDIFSAYADTAYEIEKRGQLADLNKYFKKSELNQYIDSYIKEGEIGLGGELRILPIAKATEVFVLNFTDWADFANDCGYDTDDLSTYESLFEVSKSYYEWTDSKTPEIANDGKAFFGRDSMANMFIIASMEFDNEIFQVSEGKCNLNVSSEVMKKLWDYYYVPYISGYYFASGNYRSDDTKTGDILSYIASTASANYTPTSVTINEGQSHNIEPKILPVPHFADGANVQVQQGAGMIVTKSDRKREYASVEFLKWFTEKENNTEFSLLSGYLPVKKEANNYNSMKEIAESKDIKISDMMDATLKVTFEATNNGTLYTNKAFDGGVTARAVLESHLQKKCVKDRASIVTLLASGTSLEDAVEQFSKDSEFEIWLESFKTALNAEIIK